MRISLPLQELPHILTSSKKALDLKKKIKLSDWIPSFARRRNSRGVATWPRSPSQVTGSGGEATPPLPRTFPAFWEGCPCLVAERLMKTQYYGLCFLLWRTSMKTHFTTQMPKVAEPSRNTLLSSMLTSLIVVFLPLHENHHLPPFLGILSLMIDSTVACFKWMVT